MNLGYAAVAGSLAWKASAIRIGVSRSFAFFRPELLPPSPPPPPPPPVIGFPEVLLPPPPLFSLAKRRNLLAALLILEEVEELCSFPAGLEEEEEEEVPAATGEDSSVDGEGLCCWLEISRLCARRAESLRACFRNFLCFPRSRPTHVRSCGVGKGERKPITQALFPSTVVFTASWDPCPCSC